MQLFCVMRRDNIVEEKVIYIDVTNEWLKNVKPNSHKVVIDNFFIDDDGIKHPIKGKEKVEKNPATFVEMNMAKWLIRKFGGVIHRVPRIETEKGNYIQSSVKTPDFIWNNEKWDLKTPKIGGKTTIERYTKLSKQKHQATNLIFDISYLRESNDYIISLIEKELDSPYRYWIDKIILVRNYSVVRIYQKNDVRRALAQRTSL